MASLSLLSIGLLQFVVYFTILGLNRSCISSKHAPDTRKYLTKPIFVRLKFYAQTVIFAQAFPLLIDFVHPPPPPFSFTTKCQQKKKFFLIGTGHHEVKKNNRDENRRKLLCSPNQTAFLHTGLFFTRSQTAAISPTACPPRQPAFCVVGP